MLEMIEESLESGRMYFLSIENLKASRACLKVLDPGHKWLALLSRLYFITSTFDLEAGPP